MTDRIDLNADLGEDDTANGITRDIALMDLVSSCNIACGGHAGSPAVMRQMLIAAGERNVAAGAHPSYPDRSNFGRVSMDIDPAALHASITDQLDQIAAIASETGVPLRHLKPHGALYNDAQDDPELATMLVNLAKAYGLVIVGMGASAVALAARDQGLPFLAEAFIDRRYNPAGRLVPRAIAGAVLSDDGERVWQALRLAKRQPVPTSGDETLRIAADTLCLHSDSPGALKTAETLRDALQREGFIIAAPLP